ncbi:MAG: hypothetical protein KIS94_15460 [Chitinophagales bacterium]|nr:hypothetical protein [Chitinophagales bacterium]
MKTTKTISRILPFTVLFALAAGCNKQADNLDNTIFRGYNTSNAQVLTLSEINTATTLTNHAASVDYIITHYLEVNAPLVIEEGTTIMFREGAGIAVKPSGTLTATGTPSAPIVFTSETEKRGTWKGITFLSTAPQNELAYCKIELGGGASPYGSANVIIGNEGYHAAAKIINCEITTSLNIGVIIAAGSEFREFKENKLLTNSSFGVTTDLANAPLITPTNVFSNNGKEFIQIKGYGCNKPVSAQVKLAPLPTPYLISGDIYMCNLLSISEGVKLYMDKNAALIIDGTSGSGTLNAVGTQAQPIVIAPLYQGKGVWGNIRFLSSNSVNNRIEYCRISGGGDEGICQGANAMLTISAGNEGSKVIIRNNIIYNSSSYGIAVEHVNCEVNDDLLSGNVFESNDAGNVLFQ